MRITAAATVTITAAATATITAAATATITTADTAATGTGCNSQSTRRRGSVHHEVKLVPLRQPP